MSAVRRWRAFGEEQVDFSMVDDEEVGGDEGEGGDGRVSGLSEKSKWLLRTRYVYRVKIYIVIRLQNILFRRYLTVPSCSCPCPFLFLCNMNINMNMDVKT